MNFLEAVADRILKDHLHHIRDLHIVSPNRRALLFLQKILSQKISQPMWSPVLLTVDDLVQKHNVNLRADALILNYQLYQVWRESGSEYLKDRFDQFYFWGQILLRDFDDIDKHRINHKKLFQILEADMQMEMEIEGWNEDDRSEYSHFLRILSEHKTDLKTNFENIWKHIGPVYSSFKERLASQNMAYNGMLYNHLASNTSEMDIYKGKPFIFVGFNRLNACEQIILDYFRDEHQAEFYWNFDAYLLGKRGGDAGKFMLKNKMNFPDNLGYSTDMSSERKRVKIIEVPFLSAQSQIAVDIIQTDYLKYKGAEKYDFNDTLIMLPNERLLTSLMQNIPENIENVNISIGLPISTTGTYRLIEAWINMHSLANREDGKLYYKDIETLVYHPFLSVMRESFDRHFGNEEGGSDSLTRNWNKVKNRIHFTYEEFKFEDERWEIFFARPNAESFFEKLITIIEWLYNEVAMGSEDGQKLIGDHEREILSFSHQKIMMLRDIFEEQQIRVDFRFLPQLVSDIFRLNRLPFRGEPLNGLQVLGTMEARNLSFKKVIIPSVEEGYLPAPARNSFIPFSIRRLFRFPDTEDDASEQAYYFYSTLQNAEDITLLYSQMNEGLGGKEKSRFLHQIMFWGKDDLKNWEIETLSMDSNVSAVKNREISFPKSDNILRLLDQKLEKGLSQSSLNDYLDCSLRFYFKHLRGWKEEDEIAEELDFALFGSVLHKTLELLYEPFHNAMVEVEHIERMKGQVEGKLKLALVEETGFSEENFMMGSNLFFRETLKDYILAVLEYDGGRAPFTMLQHEYHVDREELNLEGFEKKVRFSGYIDRLEREGDTLRIIDYKTGKDALEFKNIEALFSRSSGSRPKAVMQALLYALLADQIKSLKSDYYSTHIFKLRDMGAGKQATEITQGGEVYSFDAGQRAEFRAALLEVFRGMYNEEEMIERVRTNIGVKCGYCAFRRVCDRDFG